jgi:hypothetical protein
LEWLPCVDQGQTPENDGKATRKARRKPVSPKGQANQRRQKRESQILFSSIAGRTKLARRNWHTACLPFKPDLFQLEALAALEFEDVLRDSTADWQRSWIAREEIRRLIEAGGAPGIRAHSRRLISKYQEFSDEFGAERVGILTGDRKENTDAPLLLAQLRYTGINFSIRPRWQRFKPISWCSTKPTIWLMKIAPRVGGGNYPDSAPYTPTPPFSHDWQCTRIRRMAGGSARRGAAE